MATQTPTKVEPKVTAPEVRKSSIKIEQHKAQEKFPSLSLFMGLPKIGKSTVMAKVPNALVLDLEGKGYNGIDVAALVKPVGLREFLEACGWFFSSENKDFKVLVIDHIRILTSYYSKQISNRQKVEFIEDIEFGRGNFQLKSKIDGFLKWINAQLALQPDKYVFIVGHAVEKNNGIRLDIDGKNEVLVLGLVDAVGYIDRDEDLTTVDFKARRGIESGIRNKNLAGYEGELDWKVLFDIAEGKVKK